MAKRYPHPDYPTLVIIEAQTSADLPQPGAFFVTHQNVSLSHIANKAYGTPTPPTTMLTIAKRINRSKYNMQKCFYRYRSDDCFSSRVDSAGALTTNSWGPGAWLSLCNTDKAGSDGLGLELGTKYQVIWIPPTNGKEPWEIAESVGVVAPTTPTFPKLPDPSVVIPPSRPSMPGVDPGPGDSAEVPPEVTKKAGVGWALAAVLGAGALVTVLILTGKKKDKKGKR